MTRAENDRALWLATHVLPHEGALRSWLRSRAPSGLEVDDLIQETYSILSELDEVAHIRSIKAYAFRTAWTLIADHVRRSKIVSMQAMAEVEAFEPIDETPSPENQVADRQELHQVATAIAGLSARCREVVVLRKVHGLTQRQVAVRLGISEGVVEKHLAKGLRKLTAMFGRGGVRLSQPSKLQQTEQQSVRSVERGER